MQKTRIVELREERGWTQERLAAASGVGLRTVQRLEAGKDASLETLSLVAEALRVPVRELFDEIDDADLSIRVDSLHARAAEQQAARNRVSGAWNWLFIGVGVVVTLVSLTIGATGSILFLAYWAGGSLIFISARRIYLEPRLAGAYPLSKSRRELRSLRKPWIVTETETS